MAAKNTNVRPKPDKIMVDIADYALNYKVTSKLAYETAAQCLMDTLACAIEALGYPECAKLVGPVVPGTIVPNGARVPGTSFQLDPIRAAFNLGSMIRWLDYNDAWLAVEMGHPSDNLGGILAVADYLSRTRVAQAGAPLTMRDVLMAMIKAHEIQGVLGIENSFHGVGLDHVILVKVATAAVVTVLLGGTKEEVINAVSNAWIDGHSLRCYRHAPNTGFRKGWAAGDATSRGVMLAMMAVKGEMGYPSALTAKTWGFYDVLFRGQSFKLPRPYGSYVMENVLFKVSYPAAFHVQSAIECGVQLHPQVVHRLDDIESVEINAHRACMRVLDRTGPLNNPAARDHCLQYMVAVALLRGNVVSTDYEDAAAADPRIDMLRARTTVTEDPRFTKDLVDPDKRSNANAIRIRFKDGTRTRKVTVEYPIGHPRRRAEALPLLLQKFRTCLAHRFPGKQQAAILDVCADRKRLGATPVHQFVDMFAI